MRVWQTVVKCCPQSGNDHRLSKYQEMVKTHSGGDAGWHGCWATAATLRNDDKAYTIHICMLVYTYMRVRRLKSNYQAERMAVRVWVSNYNFFYNEVNAESRRIKIKNSFLHTFKWRLPITSGRHNGNTNKQTTSQLLGKTKKSKIIKSVASKIKKKRIYKEGIKIQHGKEVERFGNTNSNNNNNINNNTSQI